LDVETMQSVESEPNLSSLHGDPRFEVLLAAVRQRVEAAKAK
jgi:hypothetical protein